jgi:hypothetical protein
MFDVLTEKLSSEELREMHELLNEELIQAAAAAERRMVAIGQLNARGGVALDGLGAITDRLDPFHYWAQVGMQKADPRDPDFKPWLLKREESDYARVRFGGTRLQVGWTPPNEKRFHKTYQ